MGGGSDAGEEGGFCLAAGADDDAAGAAAGDVAVTMMALGIVDVLDGWDCLTVGCRRL